MFTPALSYGVSVVMGCPLSDEYMPIIRHDMDPKYNTISSFFFHPFAEANPSAPEIPLSFHLVAAQEYTAHDHPTPFLLPPKFGGLGGGSLY